MILLLPFKDTLRGTSLDLVEGQGAQAVRAPAGAIHINESEKGQVGYAKISQDERKSIPYAQYFPFTIDLPLDVPHDTRRAYVDFVDACIARGARWLAISRAV